VEGAGRAWSKANANIFHKSGVDEGIEIAKGSNQPSANVFTKPCRMGAPKLSRIAKELQINTPNPKYPFLFQ
jgi:hypothetical protein